MADSTPSEYHLAYLRERWERDRSSRVFLQLAEEYRRRGLLDEALEVLQVGLSHHPGYLAAQVSLGRCWLEADKPEAAAEVLEGVLAQDPTQAVASRLLVDVWLRLGDGARAQAALERCVLLGVPPRELQGQRERLAELAESAEPRGDEAEPAGEEGAAAAAASAPAERVPAAFPGLAANLTPPSHPPPRRPAAVFDLPPVPHVTLVLPERPPLRPRLRVAGGEPFVLPRPVAVAPAAGAVFALGLAAAVPAARPAVVEPVFAEAASVLVEAPAEPVAAPQGAWADVEEPTAPAMPAPELEATPAGSVPRPATAELAPAVEAPAETSAAAEPSDPARWWRPSPGVSTEPPAPEPPAAVDTSDPPQETPGVGGVEVQATGALPAPELRPSDPGTATLGELYLRQGHLREAGEIFNQVLERDPENETALRGLEAIARQRTAALTAADLLPAGGSELQGLTSRKILVLERYLRQIRAAALRESES